MKCAEPSKSAKVLESLPVRGAWIEMLKDRRRQQLVYHVAPRAGSVD